MAAVFPSVSHEHFLNAVYCGRASFFFGRSLPHPPQTQRRWVLDKLFSRKICLAQTRIPSPLELCAWYGQEPCSRTPGPGLAKKNPDCSSACVYVTAFRVLLSSHFLSSGGPTDGKDGPLVPGQHPVRDLHPAPPALWRR